MNYEKLRQFIKSKGMTYKEYGEKVLNIHNTQSLDYKFRGVYKFTIEQIRLTRNYFNLTDKQVVDFFIAD